MKAEPGSWQHDLVELLETLKRHRVPFLIAGGYAVAHAGHLRATKDLDIFVPRTTSASARLARALSEFLFIRKLPGVTWPTAWKGRSVGLFFGIEVPFLGIEALIRNKRAIGHHVDLADVEQLVRIRRERKS